MGPARAPGLTSSYLKTSIIPCYDQERYEKGSVIIVHEQYNAEICTQNGDKSRRYFKIPANTEFKIAGERQFGSVLNVIILWNSRWYLVPEKLIRKPEYYWYVNSSGGIFRAIVGRDIAADKFRKEIGNYHTTSYDAQTYKSVLREKLHLEA